MGMQRRFLLLFAALAAVLACGTGMHAAAGWRMSEGVSDSAWRGLLQEVVRPLHEVAAE